MTETSPWAFARDNIGLKLYRWSGDQETVVEQSKVECRVCVFSSDGSYFAYADAEIGVNVLDMASNESIMKLDLPRTLHLRFSPDNSLLCTWENFSTTRENAYGKENLRIFNIASKQLLYSVIQKDIEVTGLPQWFPGSLECGVLTGNTVNFFPDDQFKNTNNTIGHLHIEKLTKFELSSNTKGKQHVACFVKGSKGGPASVRVFPRGGYGQSDILANKSFYKADQANINWNNKGNAVLVTALQESDTTGQSYYGEQSLHFISTRGDTALVSLSKKGPIYDAKWSPDSSYFCVVFGYMPAKAALFNMKCDPIFEFKQAPRNECFFNPHGNLVALCGFGNLRGNIEVWDLSSKVQVSEFQDPDTTYFGWCADGGRFMTATTTPRLRVNNGFKMWHYLKGQLNVHKCEKSLFQVCWQPMDHANFPAPVEHIKSGGQTIKFEKAKAPAAYIPPHARGNPQYSTKLSLDEEESTTNNVPLSKAALKNKKKRNRKNEQAAMRDGMSGEQQDAVKMVGYLLNNQDKPAAAPAGGEKSEKEKKLKKLRKGLAAIEKLKVQQKEGKVLEKNQIEKIASEDKMKAELEQLESEQ